MSKLTNGFSLSWKNKLTLNARKPDGIDYFSSHLIPEKQAT